MSGYLYDDLLESHYKVAFWGAVARAGMKALPTVGKFGLGAATGIPIGAAGAAGAVAGQVAPMMSSVGKQVGPSVAGFGPKLASSRREKSAEQGQPHGHGIGSKLLHIAPYGAWAAGHLLDESHPRLAKALTAGAYLGYAGTSAHEAMKNPNERLTSGIDAAALTAMLGADIARWSR